MSQWVKEENNFSVRSRFQDSIDGRPLFPNVKEIESIFCETNAESHFYVSKGHSDVRTLFFAFHEGLRTELRISFRTEEAALSFYNRVVTKALGVSPRESAKGIESQLSFGRSLSSIPVPCSRPLTQQGFKSLLAEMEKDLDFTEGMKSLIKNKISPVLEKFAPVKAYGNWKKLPSYTVKSGTRQHLEFVYEGVNLCSGIVILGEANCDTYINMSFESAEAMSDFIQHAHANTSLEEKKLFPAWSSPDCVNIGIGTIDDKNHTFGNRNTMTLEDFILFLRTYKVELKMSDEMIVDIKNTLDSIEQHNQENRVENPGSKRF